MVERFIDWCAQLQRSVDLSNDLFQVPGHWNRRMQMQ
jgi:hypothetical protein